MHLAECTGHARILTITNFLVDHTNRSDEGELVKSMDNFPRDACREDGMSLLEVAMDNLNGHATNVVICMLLQEGLDILMKPRSLRVLSIFLGAIVLAS